MKEALDAVIEFKGEYPYSNLNPYIVYGAKSQGYSAFWSDDELNDEYWVSVCSRNEFNALVDELASNFGKCDISYQKHCSNEVTRLEGNKMKTVTHEGKVYQIGAVYEFSNGGKSWFPGKLHGFDGAGYFSATCGEYAKIRLQQAPIGTITAAPVELVDGKAYQFNARGYQYCGIYNEDRKILNVDQGQWFDVVAVTNIQPLTVEK